MRNVVISLCDLTGNFVQPWVDAGFTAILVDPQHGHTRWEGSVLKVADTVLGAAHIIGEYLDSAAFVAGWPPCTDMAVSGARWFESKRQADPEFYTKAVMVAEQCRTLAKASGAPYLIENPVSTLSRVFGKPDHMFHPWHYSGWEPQDNYTKKTCLWTGNGFVMPPQRVDESLGEPDAKRIHHASPGPERENFRSATPMGFARAVFSANRREV